MHPLFFLADRLSELLGELPSYLNVEFGVEGVTGGGGKLSKGFSFERNSLNVLDNLLLSPPVTPSTPNPKPKNSALEFISAPQNQPPFSFFVCLKGVKVLLGVLKLNSDSLGLNGFLLLSIIYAILWI